YFCPSAVLYAAYVQRKRRLPSIRSAVARHWLWPGTSTWAGDLLGPGLFNKLLPKRKSSMSESLSKCCLQQWESYRIPNPPPPTTSDRFNTDLAVNANLAPCLASSTARNSPIPLEAPVIHTTFPLNSAEIEHEHKNEDEKIYGGCQGPEAMYVKLISSDGHEFVVKKEHALTSGSVILRTYLSVIRNYGSARTDSPGPHQY
ncbi:unnamed protein product, partial [Nesidiocoris tenuis]